MKLQLSLWYLFFSHANEKANAVVANPIETDVLIVGAGAAGLSAAKTLLATRSDDVSSITILEATDRIGGRVFSKTLGSTRVEMGAEEHYGPTGDNPVYDALTSCYGPEIYEEVYTGTGLYQIDDGDVCATVTSGDSPDYLSNCADDDDWVDFTRFFGSYYKPPFKFSDRTVEGALASWDKFGAEAGDRGWTMYDNEFAAEYGTSCDELGARSLAKQDFQWSLSESVYGNTEQTVGYNDALNNVWWQETLSNPSVTLELESPVISIDTDSTSDHVLVKDDDGKVYKAKSVIVTASIGVLKAGVISFKPSLPDNISKAIEDIGFDNGMKVVMKFNDPWWVSAIGDAGIGWLVPMGPASICWPLSYKGSNDHMLMCFSMGKNAELLQSLNSDDAIIEQVLSDLDAMFPDAPIKPSSNYDGEGIVQDWGKEYYTQGAYSFPSLETIKENEDALTANARVTLQKPVAGGRILFAGEGTHITAMATVPGAVLEGERAAMAVPTLSSSSSSVTTSTYTPTCKCKGEGQPCSGSCTDCCFGYKVKYGDKTCTGSMMRKRELKKDEQQQQKGPSWKAVDTRGQDMQRSAKAGKASQSARL